MHNVFKFSKKASPFSATLKIIKHPKINPTGNQKHMDSFI